MNENLPAPINNDADLAYYENYLDVSENENNRNSEITVEDGNMSYNPLKNRNLPSELKNTAYMPAFLSRHIGKLVRVEHLLGGTLHQRIGILMAVGAGFIVLRSKNNCTLVCDSDSIRFVTIIHNNDLNSLMNNY